MIVTPEDVDKFIDPEDRPHGVKFTSLPLATQQSLIATAESSVIGRLPLPYRGLMSGLQGLVLRRDNNWQVPRLAQGGVDSFEIFAADKSWDNYSILEKLDIATWPPPSNAFPSHVNLAIANIAFGADGPQYKPPKLVELICRYIVSTMYRGLPAMASDPITMQKVVIEQDALRAELKDLSMGKLTIPEFEEIEIADRVKASSDAARFIKIDFNSGWTL